MKIWVVCGLKNTNCRPMLYLFLFCCFFQALTYRVGHHSTSDDSTKYRPANEIERWRLARDPVARFRKWIERNGWWNDMAESELRNSLRHQVKYLISENPLVDTRYHTTLSVIFLEFDLDAFEKSSPVAFAIATALECLMT